MACCKRRANADGRRAQAFPLALLSLQASGGDVGATHMHHARDPQSTRSWDCASRHGTCAHPQLRSISMQPPSKKRPSRPHAGDRDRCDPAGQIKLASMRVWDEPRSSVGILLAFAENQRLARNNSLIGGMVGNGNNGHVPGGFRNGSHCGY